MLTSATAGGYSLFEMLISLALSSIIMITTSSFYPLLQTEILHNYQQFRLEQSVQHAMVGLMKDLRRAGFIANHPEKMTAKAIVINQQQDCILIRYDSEIRGDWIYQPINSQDADLFAYRYNKNSVEYKVGAVNCSGNNWEKLLDTNEIRVTHFKIKQHHNTFVIDLNAELKHKPHINYQFTRIIKYENF
ncbi:prepilin peptidase-dependent protein [Orbaceae bacterium ESL0727]|nr:prepilin peptidase-dependent protein [Orbaceae bacterium ESL0727]